MGNINLSELNKIIIKNLYIREKSYKRENENLWADVASEKFEGYEGSTLASELHKIVADKEIEIYALAHLIDWRWNVNLQNMLEYILYKITNYEKDKNYG